MLLLIGALLLYAGVTIGLVYGLPRVIGKVLEKNPKLEPGTVDLVVRQMRIFMFANSAIWTVKLVIGLIQGK